MKKIQVYTDGSGHTQLKAGAWAALLLFDEREIVIQGMARETTHNHMELQAVVEAILYIRAENFIFEEIEIFSDSQYVVNLNSRKLALRNKNFLTSAAIPIRNQQLVRQFFNLLDETNVSLIKVPAHKKVDNTINYNRSVDKLVRKLLREFVKTY